jgi:hypothetical protein
VILDPPLDALSVEAVLAPRQQDAAVLPLELHQADGASAAHIRTLLPHILKGFMHRHDLVALPVLQVLSGGKQGLSHETVDLPAGVGEDKEEEEEDEEEIGADDDLEVVLADDVKGRGVVGGVELLEELAEEEEDAEEDGEFVVAVLLEAHQPAVEDDDVLQTDHVHRRRRQVHHVLPDPVLVPVRDSQDQQGQCDQRLGDA